MRPILFLLVLSCIAPPKTSSSEEVSDSSLPPEQLEFFEKKIRPALAKHCYQCHAEEGDKVKGGLLLDTRMASQSGGDSGPAVVPFDLDQSLLYTAITYDDSSLEMPPKYKLDDSVIADFRDWIAMGAPDPRLRRASGSGPEEYTNTIDLEEGKKFWAYQVPMKPPVPAIEDGDWARSSIDAFVSRTHAKHSLVPAPDADPLTLLRRLSYDLIGLPPSREEIDTFLAAHATDPEQAIAREVDRLLASDRFGERWGRRWLDVARFAESTGKEVNATLPHAWRYRNYVIDSFNEGKPFDEFVIEQIAGDLISAKSDQEKAMNVVATSFLAIGTKGLNEQNSRQFRFDLVDEQIDTTTQAFLGTTVSCARCHDHKFDPIPMADYYAMAGIFLSSETLFGTAESLQNRKATELIPLPDSMSGGSDSKSIAELIDMELQRDLLQERLGELSADAREARRSGDGDAATQ
ncbi:MAG: DUF1549 domain-containing protein, partial [Verrucomicrobiota bacterium]